MKELALSLRFLRRARKTKFRAQAVQDMIAFLHLAGDSEGPKHSLPVVVFTDQLDSVLEHVPHAYTVLSPSSANVAPLHSLSDLVGQQSRTNLYFPSHTTAGAAPRDVTNERPCY